MYGARQTNQNVNPIHVVEPDLVVPPSTTIADNGTNFGNNPPQAWNIATPAAEINSDGFDYRFTSINNDNCIAVGLELTREDSDADSPPVIEFSGGMYGRSDNTNTAGSVNVAVFVAASNTSNGASQRLVGEQHILSCHSYEGGFAGDNVKYPLSACWQHRIIPLEESFARIPGANALFFGVILHNLFPSDLDIEVVGTMTVRKVNKEVATLDSTR